jgi:uncharacterized membrane protein
MLLNESPKSNPVPKWDETFRQFILLGIIPGLISCIYLIYPENLIVGLIGITAMGVSLRGTLLFVVKVIRMNVESRKRR